MDHSFSHNWQLSKAVVRSPRGVVASQSRRAAEIGAAVLASGGNAIDAAVATSFAVGVLEPWMNGIGGGGCMLVYIAKEKRCYAVDFTMVAPASLDPSDYPLTGRKGAADLFGWPGVEGDRNVHGPLAIAVPGTVDGVGLALERFGTRPWAELVAPAIAEAEQGMMVDWYATLLIATATRDLLRYPVSRGLWLENDAPPVGDWSGTPKRIRFPKLAETLRQIAAGGRRAFYEGPLAERVARDVQAAGGRLTADDLARYQARIVEPIRLGYRGHDVWAMSGLTAGPTVARCFAELAALDTPTGTAPDTARVAATAAILKAAYAERLVTMGETDDSKAAANTTHLTAVDGEGNMVSLTQTLLSLFGSRVTLGETGILMNNGIMWFDPRPGGPNSMAPGKRPLTNMCPLVAARDGAPAFAIGASGGRRIMPAVFQIATYLMDYGMDLESAFAAPRIDVNGPDAVTADPRFDAATLAVLKDRFAAQVLPRLVYPKNYACPVAVMIDARTGERLGTCEPSQPWPDAAAA